MSPWQGTYMCKYCFFFLIRKIFNKNKQFDILGQGGTQHFVQKKRKKKQNRKYIRTYSQKTDIGAAI